MNTAKRGALALTLVSAVAIGGSSIAAAGTSSPAASPTAASAPAARITVHPMPIMAMDFDYAKLLSQLRGKQLETTFMAGMISHHQAAIDMALVARKRASHAAVRAMAADIVTSQRREQQQMTGWLKAWYGLTPAQAMAQAPADARRLMRVMDQQMMHHVMMLRQMPAGPGFDKMFLQMMIPHHQMAINEAQPAQDGVVHQQLLATANAIVSSQAREVQQMLHWLAAWYGGR